MEKNLYKIAPYFGARIWGGNLLKERYNYETDVFPVGEVYNVVALPSRADCTVIGTNMTLSELYTQKSEWFDCDTKELPIRVNILDPLQDLSIQLHPDDEYASKHDNSRGKPEAWVILDTPEDGYIGFGHNAKTREEFKKMALSGGFDKLLKYIPAKKDYYLDIPAGTLHSIGKNVLTYNISRNADLTYRLYDYNRVDSNIGKERELHIQKVIDNVIVPDTSKGFVWVASSYENGCEITRYWNEPGLYTLLRIKTCDKCYYEQERFGFITIVEGNGKINDVEIKKGETIFVPDHYGKLFIKGKLDMFMATYRNIK